MLALVVALLVVVALLGVVVTGLLRSHADIVRALHALGVGLGDPTGSEPPVPVSLSGPPAMPGPGSTGLRVAGPLGLPAERSVGSVHDIQGVTPQGDPVVVSMASSPRTLLAFLSSGCSSCAGFWKTLADPAQRSMLPAGTRIVAVVKGPDSESPADIAARTPEGVSVVMSTEAWIDYEIPGSPYVVMVDGPTGSRLGEGVAPALARVADLLGRAQRDEHAPGSLGQAGALGLSGAEREAHNDAVLMAAGIPPGHPSLYPGRRQPGADRGDAERSVPTTGSGAG
jgi:hypothetical protein